MLDLVVTAGIAAWIATRAGASGAIAAAVIEPISPSRQALDPLRANAMAHATFVTSDGGILPRWRARPPGTSWILQGKQRVWS
ncbi:Hypothetical protein A7982_05099 [Minicystis rosea]|nr:Hypothetical protein A7982_05099 [Minicystis rosea]